MRDDVSAQNRTSRALRIRLLSLSTGDMLVQELSNSLAVSGFDAEISYPGFGAVIAELLVPSSDEMDGHIIQMDVQGLYKRDWRQASEAAERLLADRIETFAAALERFATARAAPIVINSLPAAAYPQAGLLDVGHPDGAAFLVHCANRRLREVADRCPNVLLIDADMAMAQIAAAQRSDPKLWFYGRIPYSAPATKALAQAMAHALVAPRRPPVKVLALDLDDTLWRGIYGEQGIEGLECGDDFPGNAFKAFQEECLRLKSQGLLLAIVSKNDMDVLRVFDEHPGMALRCSDFSGYRINWEPKADNIRALSEELGLGLDSFLFLDDSPHEREAMRRLAPKVHVPELPADPARRPNFLRAQMALWPSRLTAEDRGRTELYALQTKGRALQAQAASLGEYLAGLEQRLIVEGAVPADLPRLVQMHARTNQFNLTTFRLSETGLAAMIADPDGYRVLKGRLADKFGDHGVVICATVKLEDRRASIETLLMSCRVIGRDVETAFLGAVLRHLCAGKIDLVEGTYVPTAKNGPARDFYEAAGFTVAEPTSATGQTWQWRRGVDPVPVSNFVRVEATVPLYGE